MSALSFKVVTPNSWTDVYECDSIHLIMHDDANGKNGGSMGIRKGHPDALIALGPGKAEALRDDGSVVYSIDVQEGFAVVKNNEVTIITEQRL